MIFYADKLTNSISRTVEGTRRRRDKQLAYNREHGITPRGVTRSAQASLHVYDGTGQDEAAVVAESGADDVAAVIAELEEEMQEAANKLEFERAALLRDQVNALKSGDFRKDATKAAKSAHYGRSKKKGPSSDRWR